MKVYKITFDGKYPGEGGEYVVAAYDQDEALAEVPEIVRKNLKLESVEIIGGLRYEGGMARLLAGFYMIH